MATIIPLHKQRAGSNSKINIASRFKTILEKRGIGQVEPLTPEKLRKRPGLEQITDAEALAIVDTIKKLAAIFFEIACNKEANIIDNQYVVHLNQQKKAA